jgi:hypothetical protein
MALNGIALPVKAHVKVLHPPSFLASICTDSSCKSSRMAKKFSGSNNIKLFHTSHV